MALLDGKELEGQIGNVGTYEVDVSIDGSVIMKATVAYVTEYGEASSTNAIKTDIFKIAEALAKKTETTWDDAAVEALKKVLGIKAA